MLYELTLPSGEKMWMNERIIKEIYPNEDGTFTLFHFNGSSMKINWFAKFNHVK